MLRLLVRSVPGCVLVSVLWLAGCDDDPVTRPDAGQNIDASLGMDAGDAAPINDEDAGQDASHVDASAVDASLGNVDEDASVSITAAHETQDDDCDGVPNRCVTRSYNRFGKLTITRIDDCNGGAASCESTSFDAAGRMLAQGADDDCDGTPDHPCAWFEYDAEGRVIRSAAQVFDEYFCGPQLGLCTTFVRDTAGNITRTEVDFQCDGVLDRCATHVLDGAGNIISTEADDGCDGTIDQCLIRQIDATGGEIGTAIDRDCDGMPDELCAARTFDSTGLIMSFYRDANCDGVGETDCARTTRDTAGNPTEALTDRDCDGTAESVRVETYDAAGNELSSFDGSCRVTSTYDTQGRVIGERYTGSCGGDIECFVTTYSDDGVQRTRGGDADCNGVADDNCFTRGVDSLDPNVGSHWDDNCDGVPDHHCVAVVVEP